MFVTLPGTVTTFAIDTARITRVEAFTEHRTHVLTTDNERLTVKLSFAQTVATINVALASDSDEVAGVPSGV